MLMEQSLRTPAEKAQTPPEINEVDPQQNGKSLLDSIKYFCPYRLGRSRTSGFHPDNRGSNPRRGAIFKTL